MVGDEGSMPESGILESPNYPHRYPNDHDSTQTIEVAEGKTIRFSFTHFDTEREYDYVRILDRNENNLTPELFDLILLTGPDGTPASNAAPSPIGKDCSTDSNSLQVEFITDSSGRGRGWKLKWTEQ